MGSSIQVEQQNLSQLFVQFQPVEYPLPKIDTIKIAEFLFKTTEERFRNVVPGIELPINDLIEPQAHNERVHLHAIDHSMGVALRRG